jgi:hypothetical protein
MTRFRIGMLLIAAAGFGTALSAQAPPQATPTPQQRVAALKQSLQEGQAKLRQYEWVETTIISLKGEEKARKQQRCYYGADGKLQKIPIGDAAAQPASQEAKPSGGRGSGRMKKKIVENKKDEMKEYMEKAAALVHQYVPPKPNDIQSAQAAGKVKVTSPTPGQAHLEIKDYLKAGDQLAIDVDGAANRLLALAVNSYLDKAEDKVTLNVQFAALADGASYAGQTTLEAPAKNIRVVIQNTGHRPVQK